MCVFTIDAPYVGARCISTMSPARDCDAKGSAEPARLMRYDAWIAIVRSPSRSP